MSTERSVILGRRQLVRMFSVTMGFVEGLERIGKIHPKDVYVGELLYKSFSARDVSIIRECALASATGSCRNLGKRMAAIMRKKKSGVEEEKVGRSGG